MTDYEPIYRRRQTLIQRNRQFLFEYLLEHPCTDCGEGDPIVLEFHHKRDKEAHVSELVNHAASLVRIKAEIKKCIVVCANCHRRRTAKAQSWSKLLKISA